MLCLRILCTVLPMSVHSASKSNVFGAILRTYLLCFHSLHSLEAGAKSKSFAFRHHSASKVQVRGSDGVRMCVSTLCASVCVAGRGVCEVGSTGIQSICIHLANESQLAYI